MRLVAEEEEEVWWCVAVLDTDEKKNRPKD